MAESENKIRISKVKGEFNVSLARIWDYLEEMGHKIERNPNGKISDEQYHLLLKEFAQDREEKEESKLVGLNTRTKKESVEMSEEPNTKASQRAQERDQEEVLIKDMNSGSSKTSAPEKEKPKKVKEKKEEEITRVKAEPTVNLKVVDKIDLEPAKTKAKKKKEEDEKAAAEETEIAASKKKKARVSRRIVKKKKNRN